MSGPLSRPGTLCLVSARRSRQCGRRLSGTADEGAPRVDRGRPAAARRCSPDRTESSSSPIRRRRMPNFSPQRFSPRRTPQKTSRDLGRGGYRKASPRAFSWSCAAWLVARLCDPGYRKPRPCSPRGLRIICRKASVPYRAVGKSDPTTWSIEANILVSIYCLKKFSARVPRDIRLRGELPQSSPSPPIAACSPRTGSYTTARPQSDSRFTN